MNRFTQLTQELTEFRAEVRETVPQGVQESVEVLKVDTTALVPGETYYVQYPPDLNFVSFVGKFKHMTGHLKGTKAVFDTKYGQNTIPCLFQFASCYTTFQAQPIQPENTLR